MKTFCSWYRLSFKLSLTALAASTMRTVRLICSAACASRWWRGSGGGVRLAKKALAYSEDLKLVVRSARGTRQITAFTGWTM